MIKYAVILFLFVFVCVSVFSEGNDAFVRILEKFGIVNENESLEIENSGGYSLTRDSYSSGDNVKVHYYNFSIGPNSKFEKFTYPFDVSNYRDLIYANSTLRIGGQTFSDPWNHLVTIQADHSECFVQNANHVRVYVNLMLVYSQYGSQ